MFNAMETKAGTQPCKSPGLGLFVGVVFGGEHFDLLGKQAADGCATHCGENPGSLQGFAAQA